MIYEVTSRLLRSVDFDVSGGWGTLLILFMIELILGYLILAGKSSLEIEH